MGLGVWSGLARHVVRPGFGGFGCFFTGMLDATAATTEQSECSRAACGYHTVLLGPFLESVTVSPCSKSSHVRQQASKATRVHRPPAPTITVARVRPYHAPSHAYSVCQGQQGKPSSIHANPEPHHHLPFLPFVFLGAPFFLSCFLI